MLNQKVLSRIENTKTVREHEPLNSLSTDNQLMCFKHSGFWQPMDTIRDRVFLEELWNQGKAPWKVW